MPPILINMAMSVALVEVTPSAENGGLLVTPAFKLKVPLLAATKLVVLLEGEKVITSELFLISKPKLPVPAGPPTCPRGACCCSSKSHSSGNASYI